MLDNLAALLAALLGALGPDYATHLINLRPRKIQKLHLAITGECGIFSSHANDGQLAALFCQPRRECLEIFRLGLLSARLLFVALPLAAGIMLGVAILDSEPDQV